MGCFRTDTPIILGVALLAAALGVAGPLPATEAPPDLVLVGGRVWTAEASRPWAEAVAVRGGRVLKVGTTEEVTALAGPRTERIALGGRLALPGFIDAHVHLMGGALSLDRVDLIEEQSLAAVQAKIRAFADANPTRPWVLGRGWLYGSFPGGLPVREQLDAVVSDRPAYMECYDGHTGWANSKALALAGVTRDTKDPEAGVIVRDPRTGEPTGVLKEAAAKLVESRIPMPDAGARQALLAQAFRRLAAQGITSVQDAGWTLDDLASDLPLVERLEREGGLTARTRIAVHISPADAGPAMAEALRLGARTPDPLLRFGALKGYVDGVVESHTAAMLAPYSDDPAFGLGTPIWTPEALNAAVTAADKAKLQVWLHAIGERGVRMALDAHAASARANGPRDRRGRIEHIETIAAADYPRFAELGVIASMQPLHANPDQNFFAIWARNAGPERASRAFSWGNLERAGARLAFGSDWPVVTSDVFRGLYCAVTRKTREGAPEGGSRPELAVSLESALRHYTIDAAYAGFDEAETGSLAAGKRADLIVLSEDLFQAPPEAILKTRVLLTLLDGRVVHREGALLP